MKSQSVASLILLCLTLAAPLGVESRAPDNWQVVGEGIAYQEFQLPDPNKIYVARMERNNPNVILESSIAQGRLSGGTETVSSMAQRYDQALNHWDNTWGQRNQVVVAINGYFYGASGVPWRGQVQSGWYAKRFDDLENGSGLAWKLDRSVFLGGCVVHRPDKQIITLLRNRKTFQISGVNIARGEDDLILYTPQYDANTLTEAEGLEVLVEMSAPTFIRPLPDMVTGTVRTVLDGQGSTPLPFDHIVLSATGEPRQKLLNANLQPGDVIGISQDLRHYEADCSTPSSYSWADTYASIGGSFYFLKKGAIQSFTDVGANIRNPRTAIAYNNDYIYFIVVDGRFPGFSVGMTMKELATFARDTLGAKWGVNQDGGGSSTLVVNGVVKNFPNAELGCYTSRKTYLPMIPASGLPPRQTTTAPGSSPRLRRPTAVPTPSRLVTKSDLKTVVNKCERYVANGMMMVVVAPMQKSTTFTPGAEVNTTASTELRLGPGSNYPALTTLTSNAAGVILQHQLDGVLAKGDYWWKVDFAGTFGWVTEKALRTTAILNRR